MTIHGGGNVHVKTIQRQVQRMRNNQAPSNQRSKAEKMMKEHGLHWRARNVHKQLLMSNVIIDEVNKMMKDKKSLEEKDCVRTSCRESS